MQLVFLQIERPETLDRVYKLSNLIREIKSNFYSLLLPDMIYIIYIFLHQVVTLNKYNAEVVNVDVPLNNHYGTQRKCQGSLKPGYKNQIREENVKHKTTSDDNG